MTFTPEEFQHFYPLPLKNSTGPQPRRGGGGVHLINEIALSHVILDFDHEERMAATLDASMHETQGECIVLRGQGCSKGKLYIHFTTHSTPSPQYGEVLYSPLDFVCHFYSRWLPKQIVFKRDKRTGGQGSPINIPETSQIWVAICHKFCPFYWK